MTINDNLIELENKLNAAKETLSTNLRDKGVTGITTANTLTEMATSVTTIPSGGGGDINTQWKEIGYDGQPDFVTDGIAYAKEVQANWDGYSKLYLDPKLRYAPFIDLSKLSTFSSFFSKCTSLTTLPLLNTSKMTSMSSTFQDCYSLAYIPLLDTSKVTSMRNTFANCRALKTIPKLNTSSVTSFSFCFEDCYSLEYIPLIDTKNVEDMSYCFNNCQSLKSIPQLNTSNVTTMNSFLAGCYSITTIPSLNTKNVTNFYSFCNNCMKLITITKLDLDKATKMDYFIDGCEKLRYVNLIGMGTQTNITKVDFQGSSWSPIENIGIDGDGVTGCRQALIDTLLTNSFDRAAAGYSACRIILATKTRALLTSSERAQITAKGYTLA